MALLMTREGLIALTQSSVALLGLMPWNQWSLKDRLEAWETAVRYHAWMSLLRADSGCPLSRCRLRDFDLCALGC